MAKLTLSINDETVERAKRISENRGKSLSEMVEEFLKSLPDRDMADETAVDKIKKIVQGKISNPEIDWKEATSERLNKKYGI